MKTRVSYSFDLEKGDHLLVTDQSHVGAVSLHNQTAAGFSVLVRPEHIPALEEAIKFLRQYEEKPQ